MMTDDICRAPCYDHRMENIGKLIEHIPLFKGLTRRQRQRIVPLFVQRSYKPGQAIVNQGGLGMGMYIIVSGLAEAIRTNSSGVSQSVSMFGPNDFFGELALLSEGERTATVYARQPTNTLILSRTDFLELLQNDAKMATMIAQTIATRFRNEINRVSHS